MALAGSRPVLLKVRKSPTSVFLRASFSRGLDLSRHAAVGKRIAAAALFFPDFTTFHLASHDYTKAMAASA
jgi:hypothetical protein